MHKAARLFFCMLLVFGTVSFGGLLLAAQPASGDTLTITTYFPSPYGTYKILRLVPKDIEVNTGGCKAGEMAYSKRYELVICGSDNIWRKSGSGGQTYAYVDPMKCVDGDCVVADFNYYQQKGDLKVNVVSGDEDTVSLFKYCTNYSACPFYDDHIRWGIRCARGYKVTFCQMVGANPQPPSAPNNVLWRLYERNAEVVPAYDVNYGESCVAGNYEFLAGRNWPYLNQDKTDPSQNDATTETWGSYELHAICEPLSN